MIYIERTPNSVFVQSHAYDWTGIYLDKSTSRLASVIFAARSMCVSFTGLS
jgi:hypothetical protein